MQRGFVKNGGNNGVFRHKHGVCTEKCALVFRLFENSAWSITALVIKALR